METTTTIPSTIFEIDVSSTLGKDYVDMFNDISRLLMIQIGIQIMLFMINPNKYPFFTVDFFALILFLTIGVMYYWLILRKIINFK